LGWLIHDSLTRFIAQIVTILAASRGLGLLARRIGQPVVIAEVAAGIALGPSVLGWLAPDVAYALFPPGSLGVVRMVSQLGLILFMFLVGLELDLRLLRGRARASIVISQTSIAVPFALGIAVAFALRATYALPDVPFASFAVFMGAAMSITAFPVLARILTERRLLRTRVGTITIACAAVDDVTAWCLLAFAVSLAHTDGVENALMTTLVAAGYIVLMLVVIRPVLARLAARVSTPGAMSQNMVALVLLLVMLSSWATERIGVHVLFGAFLVGVVVPKEGGFARALAEKLEDAVVIILLPLFFAVSGLRTQIGLLASHTDWAVCGVLILVASIGKFGGGTAAARFTGLSWREAGAVGVLMNTRGLMELIALNIGLELGVISPTVFSMMVIMALVTTFMTTPLLQRIYPPSVMARDLVADQPPAPTHRDGFRVMACVSHASAGPSLIAMARAIGGESEVVALHLESPADRASAHVGRDRDATPVALTTGIEHARAHGVLVKPLSFVSTDPAEDISRVADVRDIDLILLGVHKPVLSQTLLGGVVHEVMHQAEATVAVYIERRGRDLGRILVPFQGSPHDRAALAIATRIQLHRTVEITLLHVIGHGRPGEAHATVETFVEAGGRVHVETVEHESPATVAVERAAMFDLVIVGVGHEWGLGDRRLGFGLHPERLIRECPSSLLVVRAPRDTRHLALARVESEA